MKNTFITLLLSVAMPGFCQTIMNIHEPTGVSTFNISNIDSITYTILSTGFPAGDGVTDIDGNTYTSLIIDAITFKNGNTYTKLEWMKENLKTQHYANGDLIPNVTDESQWDNLSTGAWCYYDNDVAYESPNGKLYNWYAAVDTKNVCPNGWDLPNFSDWSRLNDAIDPTGLNIGRKMKTLTGWQNGMGGTNESGFSAYPSGNRNYGFGRIGERTEWWRPEVFSPANAGIKGLSMYDSNLYTTNVEKTAGNPIRCVKRIP